MGQDEKSAPACPPANRLKARVAEFERTLIMGAMLAANGNQRRAAALLGVLPSTLCEKIRRLGIREALHPRPDPRPPEAGAAELRAGGRPGGS